MKTDASTFREAAEGLFDDATMAKLAKMLCLTDSDRLAAFRADLVEMCAYYREVISTLPCDLPDAPFNISLTKRADWLEANVINLCERLLAAVGDDMRPMFSTWPYPLSIPTFRDNGLLKSELAEITSAAVRLRDMLRGQQSDDAGHSQELRAEVFIALAQKFRNHCPEVKPNRGVYDPELRRRVGGYVDAIRLAHHKIAGVEDSLDRWISGEIKMPS